MAEKYGDSNGEYQGYGAEFKRSSEPAAESMDAEADKATAASQKAVEYVSELLHEKHNLDQNKYPHASKLIEQEIAKVQNIGKVPAKEMRYVDIYRERPMKVAVKVLVPVREHPKPGVSQSVLSDCQKNSCLQCVLPDSRLASGSATLARLASRRNRRPPISSENERIDVFNFVGKLLGPKGNSMKRLQEETMCKMAVLGRGSMKDRQKEEELRKSCDPKYAHLSDDLHVEISALGPPAEAHARVAFALAEVRKYLIPDNNDNIRQEQMREMEIMTAESAHDEPPARGPPPRVARGSAPPRKPSYEFSSVSRPPVQMRTATRTPVATPRVMPAKTKIMSILDRARIAMEESYGYENGYEATSPVYSPDSPTYSPYSPSSYQYDPPPSSHYRTASSHHYEPGDYRPNSDSYRETSSQRWKSYKASNPSTSRQPESSRYRSSPYTRPSK